MNIRINVRLGVSGNTVESNYEFNLQLTKAGFVVDTIKPAKPKRGEFTAK